MIQGKDIVCVSSLDWDAHWTSKQQIMHLLAQGSRILYVEEPITMLAPLKVPARWRRWGALMPRLRHPEPNVWTLATPPLLPFGNKRPCVNRLNQKIVARYLRWAMRKLSFGGDHLLWTYLPTSGALVDSLYGRRSRGGPTLLLYHCVDEHSAFKGYFMSAEVVRGYDDDLTRRADLVITTSDNLRKSRELHNTNTHTVINAADVELFNRALKPDLAVPADLAALPTPRLGVVGVHDYRLDLDALEALTQADPSWQVVLIGPLKPGQVDEARLRRLPSVHLLGGKPREELPAYLKGLDVALIPYVPGELTRNIFPLKLFEYLAAGLPVVAGGLPELRRFEGVIGLAGKVADYAPLVRAALGQKGSEQRAARVALAAQNSWAHRVDEISALVEQALAQKAD